jgi:two-component system response regulator RegX3
MSARVLIIEDDPTIRETLEDFLRVEGYVVTACDSAESARAVEEPEGFSVILLDVLLPGDDGITFLRQRRRAGERTPTIIITARGAEAQRIEGLEIGADDYVVKPFSLKELEARMRAVLRRVGTQPLVQHIGGAVVDLEAHTIARGQATHRLVQKEAELLAFLLRHRGRTFSRKDLLREVWGFDRAPSTRTVDTHVFTLRKKLEEDPSHPQHLVTIHGKGYRLVP